MDIKSKLRKSRIGSAKDEAQVPGSRFEVPARLKSKEKRRHANRKCAHLLIDADDTLWENNIYFERVMRRSSSRRSVARAMPIERVDQLLWETEQRNVKVTGYGSQAFCQSLHEVARQLGATELEPWIGEKETVDSKSSDRTDARRARNASPAPRAQPSDPA
jgi:hypothetical protein